VEERGFRITFLAARDAAAGRLSTVRVRSRLVDIEVRKVHAFCRAPFNWSPLWKRKTLNLSFKAITG
jgi:hypothetical protein